MQRYLSYGRGFALMPVVHFITHPEIAIDPAVPVLEWTLALSA
jgi:hypothetical protein